jgi:lipid II:glycine glycyltransferase (peptidoglycan interpeptide bridge formation enzyme)
MTEINRDTWNDLIAALPNAHVLQTWEWGAVKESYGWKPIHEVWRGRDGQVEAAALVLTRAVSAGGVNFPLRVMYVPRGPLLKDWHDLHVRNKVLAGLRTLAKSNQAIFIKMDPEVDYGHGLPGREGEIDNPETEQVIADLSLKGWIYSQDQVQFRNTMTIDLRPDIEEILSRMKQKTRYNIRLATRKGVNVRVGDLKDLGLLYRMYAETSLRDGFGIRMEEYYLAVWKTFIETGMAEPLIAEVAGDPVAAVIIFRFAGRAWYLYGMSRDAHREKMPNYVLQWEAMVRAKEAGCISYDLWGAPDEFVESDSLWGVYRFKEGLGGGIVRFIGAWDLPVNNLLYRLYTQMIPRVLAQMRRRGRKQTQGSIQAG